MKVKLTANKQKTGFDSLRIDYADYFEKVRNETIYPLLELLFKEVKADQSNQEQMRSERV